MTSKKRLRGRLQKDRPDFFFYFGLPFRQRNATCKLAATEDSRVLHKIMFRGYPIISIVSTISNGVVGETMN